jgi:tight adherence protein C
MVKMLTILQDPTILISLAGFLALFLLCLGVLQYLRLQSTRKEVLEKIKFVGETGGMHHVNPLSETNKSLPKNRLLNFFIRFGNRVKPKTFEYNTIKRIKFLRAGIRQTNAAAIFWGVKCFFVIFFPAIFLILRILVFKLMSNQLTIVIGVLISLLGFYLPDIWLRQKADKRKEKLLKALPDALDLLVVCVEAGMGLDEAINRVAKEIKFNSPELSDELNFLILEMRAGKLRQDALSNLAMRVDLEEVNNLVTLLKQAEKFGTSVADTLRVYSDSFRTQRFQKAEELAAKIPVKLVFPLVLFIFPSLFVVVAGPAALRIFHNIIMR